MRVFANLEMLAVDLVADGEPHLVRSRRGERAFHDLVRVIHALDFDRLCMARIPAEAVRPGLPDDVWLLFLILFRLFRLFIAVVALHWLWWLFLAAERANLFALSIQEGQRDFAFRLLLQVVVDDDALRGILSGIEIFIHFLAGWLLFLHVGHAECAGMAIVLPGDGGVTVAAAGCEAREGARREEIDRGAAYLVVELAQGRNVVENPERASMCCHDEVTVLNHEIVDGNGGQVQLERLPGRAVVEGNSHARLCSREQQPAPLRVFANGARKDIFS